VAAGIKKLQIRHSACGNARFEASAPLAAMGADRRFMAGPVSKWIAAVTVLRLVGHGRLDLDAPVTASLPELPAASRAVALSRLLSNTSGIEHGLHLALKRDRSRERLTISPLEAALALGNGPLTSDAVAAHHLRVQAELLHLAQHRPGHCAHPAEEDEVGFRGADPGEDGVEAGRLVVREFARHDLDALLLQALGEFDGEALAVGAAVVDHGHQFEAHFLAADRYQG
jgi:hypothetical protein